MANVKINGVNYNSVPSVQIPLQTTGTATFYDTSDATVTASDMAAGVVAYGSGGQVTGNATARDSSDLTVSGATVTVPAGIYSSTASASVNTQTKTATPTTSSQTISPDTNYLLSSVTVNAVSLTGTATADKVLNGYTFYNTSLTPVTGSASVPTVSQDGVTKVLSIS